MTQRVALGALERPTRIDRASESKPTLHRGRLFTQTARSDRRKLLEEIIIQHSDPRSELRGPDGASKVRLDRNGVRRSGSVTREHGVRIPRQLGCCVDE